MTEVKTFGSDSRTVKIFPVKYYKRKGEELKVGRAAVTTDMNWAKAVRAEIENVCSALAVNSAAWLSIVEYALPTVFFTVLKDWITGGGEFHWQQLLLHVRDIPIGMSLRVENAQYWWSGQTEIKWVVTDPRFPGAVAHPSCVVRQEMSYAVEDSRPHMRFGRPVCEYSRTLSVEQAESEDMTVTTRQFRHGEQFTGSVRLFDEDYYVDFEGPWPGNRDIDPTGQNFVPECVEEE